MFSKPDSALVIVGHGSTLNADSSTPTHEHAESIRRMGVFGEVTCCFWKEEPSMRSVLHMLDSVEVYVVPNFISEGYFTQKIIPRELELDGPVTRRAGRVLKYCGPVGSHPMMTEILLRRARDVAPGVPVEKTSLIIAGHGTDLNENSAVAAKREAEAIRALGGYAEVFNAYLEAEPQVGQWMHFTNQPNVVVVPFFISDGMHSQQDIPVLLGIAREGEFEQQRRADVFARNPHRLHGRSLYYANSVGTEPHFANVILEQVAAFDRNNP
jgi:sirohydrochlorin cobaltochelatase